MFSNYNYFVQKGYGNFEDDNEMICGEYLRESRGTGGVQEGYSRGTGRVQ